MYTSTIIASTVGLAALTTAAPFTKRAAVTETLGLNLDFKTPSGDVTTLPIMINTLTAVDLSSSSISFNDKGDGSNKLDLGSVECRAYKDDEGMHPASVPFTLASSATLSTNAVEVASVICYIAEEIETSTTTSSKETKRDPSTYHGITLSFNQAAAGATPSYTTADIEINVLTEVDLSATTIEFNDQTTNIDASVVECRAFKDDAGTQPGSAPFDVNNMANLATNPVAVGSVLCYVVADATSS